MSEPMYYDEIQNLVLEKLVELGKAQKFDTYEVDVPTGTDRPYENQASVPYVLIDFGQKGTAAVDERGITGTRDNLKWTTIVFDVVSNNPAVTRKILRIIRDEFEGYSPHPSWGQFVERVASPLYNRHPSEGTELYPPRYSRSIAYVVDVDA